MRVMLPLMGGAAITFGIFFLQGWLTAGFVVFGMAFWSLACAADIIQTVRCNSRSFLLRYEKSALLRFFLNRTGAVWKAAICTVCAEALAVLLAAPLLLALWQGGHQVSTIELWSLAGICAVLAGLVHIAGFAESRRFLQI